MRLTLLAVFALLGVASALLDSLQLDPLQQDSSLQDFSQVVDSNNCALPEQAENLPVETLLSVLSTMCEHARPDQQTEMEQLQKIIASLRTNLQAVAQTIDKIK